MNTLLPPDAAVVAPDRLAQLIAEVRAHVPFYANASAHFHEWPIVSRADLVARRADFVSHACPCDRGELVRALADPAALPGGQHSLTSHVVIEQTSGSSGLPLKVARTRVECMRQAAAIWQRRKRFDPLFTSATYVPLVNVRRPEFEITVDAGLTEYHDLLCRLAVRRARWIQVTPPLLERIVSAVQEFGRPEALEVRFVECTGQHLPATLRRRAMEGLQARCIDQYALRETWTVATADEGEDFDVLDANVVVEVVDDAGRPVPDGTLGNIVVTSFHQRLMPMVRYLTGDQGLLRRGDSGQRRLTLAPSRRDDFIAGVDGVSGREVFKGIMKQAYAMTGYDPVRYLRIHQVGPAHFEVHVDRGPHRSRLVAAIQRAFNARRLLPLDARFDMIELAPDQIVAVQRRMKDRLFSSARMRTGQSPVTDAQPADFAETCEVC